jgi:hypothetical protein
MKAFDPQIHEGPPFDPPDLSKKGPLMKIKTRKIIRKRSTPEPQPRQKLTGRAIDAMTPAEHQRLMAKFESETPEQRRARSKPVTPADQARLDRFVEKTGRGRPKLGKGTRAVSVTVEIDLLERADAYARKLDLKRAELFRQGLRHVLPMP